MTVELSDVSIRYGRHVAVHNATARIPAGTVGLLGRNGAGKSSILKAILGLVRPSSGSVRILDLSIDVDSREIRRHVGYMPEKDCHIPGLNGYETVQLVGRLSGMPKSMASRRAHEVLYLVGLDEQRYRPVAGYSLGMRQKTKLATALVHDPSLLFLDEPTNGLDPRGRSEMLALIKRLGGELRKSVVLSTHILQDVEAVATHVVLMEQGRIVANGPLQSLTGDRDAVLELHCTAPTAALHSALLAAGARQIEISEETGVCTLSLPESVSRSVVFAAVQSAGGVVRRLVERRRSLEDVFLSALAKAGERT